MAQDHPNIWDRLTDQIVEKQGKAQEDARELAKNLLIDRGHLTPDGNLTPEGEKRSAMGAEGRAIDRAIRRHGGDRSNYYYDYSTNKARKIKVEDKNWSLRVKKSDVLKMMKGDHNARSTRKEASF